MWRHASPCVIVFRHDAKYASSTHILRRPRKNTKYDFMRRHASCKHREDEKKCVVNASLRKKMRRSKKPLSYNVATQRTQLCVVLRHYAQSKFASSCDVTRHYWYIVWSHMMLYTPRTTSCELYTWRRMHCRSVPLTSELPVFDSFLSKSWHIHREKIFYFVIGSWPDHRILVWN